MEHLKLSQPSQSAQEQSQAKSWKATFSFEFDSLLSLMESQWKLREQHDQNFPMNESHCRANTGVRKK